MRFRRRNRKARTKEEEGASSGDKVKEAKPVNGLSVSKPVKLLRQVLNNPDLSYQVMVVILALTSDQVKMDRRINTMTSSIGQFAGNNRSPKHVGGFTEDSGRGPKTNQKVAVAR